MACHQRSPAGNEHGAAGLRGQVIAEVRYFPLTDPGTGLPADWDFGVWHQPTMGVELVTETGQVFSARWAEYDEWGCGVDLFAGSVGEHLIPEARIPVDVSAYRSWAALLGTPVSADFLWNDYGTGRAPCPEAIMLTAGTAAAWIIAAGWERQESRTCIQLGTDDLLIIFDGKLARALGLYDTQRGREEPHTAPLSCPLRIGSRYGG
jgi:hypothetical protein